MGKVRLRFLLITSVTVFTLLSACSNAFGEITWEPQFTAVGITPSSYFVCLGSPVTFTPQMTDPDTDRGNDLFTLVYDDTKSVDWNFGDSTTLTGQPIQPVSHTYTSIGTYTVTATFHDNDTGNSRDDPEDKQASVTVTVFKVERIALVSGATAIPDGTATPADTDVCAAVKGTGDVVVEAILNPSVSAGNLPTCFTWTGGTAVDGNPLRRKVSKSASGKHELTADCCGTNHAHMLVYIIWADPGGFNPADGRDGDHFADCNDCAPLQCFTSPPDAFPGATNKTGIYGPNSGSEMDIMERCEVEFAVKPDALITDGNAGLFDKSAIQWDVPQEIKCCYWTKASANAPWLIDMSLLRLTWVPDPDPELGQGWADRNPWNGNGHLYALDQPANYGSANYAFVKKMRLRNRVTVALGGQAAGTCSDYKYWHDFRSIIKDPEWRNDDSHFRNEIAAGDMEWGDWPTIVPEP